ncbi:MAG: exo-alpha-sialidase [Verrucomicrobiae bacterium]|nr:exo-alpha-sialidase [Verrucomicrobiae bacterium]
MRCSVHQPLLLLAPGRAALLALAIALAEAAAVGAPVLAPIAIEKVVGPETPTGPYKHPSSFTELDNGDLLLAYYGGDGEYSRESKVFGMKLPRGSRSWSEPVVIASNPFYSMGNPVVWQAPDQTVWLFFVVRPGATWSTSRIGAKISRDRGESWSDTFIVAWEAGMMVRSHPIVLADGAYLLPIYHETGSDPDRTDPDTSSLFLRFDPATRAWTESNRVFSRMGNLQAAVVELAPGRLFALCRRGGDYLPGDDGNVVRTESSDGGRTWSPGVETEFPNPNASVELIRLRNGHLLFLYNDSHHQRTPLTAAISTDGGLTWPHRRNLAEGPGSFSYPTAIQTRDGRIHVTFTSDERTVIRRAVFPESAILGASE